MEDAAALGGDILEHEFLNPSKPVDEETEEEEQLKTLNKIKEENRKKIVIIDNYINKIWLRRVFVSSMINVCLIGAALFSGMVFIVSIIASGILHVVDKYLDFNVHKLYQKKEYAKYG